MADAQRYIVRANESGDYYVVPVEQIAAFDKWVYESEGDGAAPDGVWYCGGWPHDITFTDPRGRRD